MQQGEIIELFYWGSEGKERNLGHFLTFLGCLLESIELKESRGRAKDKWDLVQLAKG